MIKEFPTLPITQVEPDECIAEYIYLPKVAHIDDSAIDVLTDFHAVKPLTFNTTDRMIDARSAMEANDLHIVLVFGSDKKLAGLLSLEQILGEKTVKMIESRRVERKDMRISSVMTPLKDVAAINFASLKYAKVGHIVSTLKAIQRYYLLVIESDEFSQKKIVRGVFLASMMSKLLGEHITIDPAQAKSIAELYKKLNHC